jgi:hypothetical protein
MAAPAKEANLKCPYTGAEMTVEPVTSKARVGSVSFRCSGGFDPTGLFSSEEELIEALKQRNGHKSNVRSLKCAYLGVPVEIIRRGNFWTAWGAFTPKSLFAEKQELLFAVSTRAGVEPEFPKALDEVQVGTVVEEISDPSADLKQSDDTAEAGIEMLIK